MKKICLIAAVLIIPIFVTAQNNFDKFVASYKGEKGVEIVRVDKDIIELYKGDNLEKEQIQLLKNIDKINIVRSSIKKAYAGSISSQLEQVNNCFDLSKFKLVRSRVDADSFSKVYIRNTKEIISELIIISSSLEDNFSTIQICTKIKSGDISKLSQVLMIDELKALDDIKEDSKSSKKYIISEKEQEKQIARIKKETKKLKKKANEIKIKAKNYDSDDFDKDIDSFAEAMTEWDEAFGDNVEKAIKKFKLSVNENFSIEDDAFNFAFRGGNSNININADDKAVCIIDGSKVDNSKMSNLNKGDISRLRMIKYKDNENVYMIVTTHSKMGKLLSYSSSLKRTCLDDNSIKEVNEEIIVFTYNGKKQVLKSTEDTFPAFIINGKKRRSLNSIDTEDIVQIRPISNIECLAYDVKTNYIVVETK